MLPNGDNARVWRASAPKDVAIWKLFANDSDSQVALVFGDEAIRADHLTLMRFVQRIFNIEPIVEYHPLSS